MKSLSPHFNDFFAGQKNTLSSFAWIFKPESGAMVWIPDHLVKVAPSETPPAPPPHIPGQDTRKTKRLPFKKAVEAYPLRPKTSNSAYHLMVRDISRDGLCLETGQPFSVGHIFLLEFKVSKEKVAHAPARVIWSQKKFSGMEFLSTDDLEEFFETHLPLKS
jgi:PilZ domain